MSIQKRNFSTTPRYLSMFGIGLPEMIVIFAIALIVVGPEKLPGLARSLAKGLVEMKKTMNQVKESLSQEGDVLNSVEKDLRKTADDLKTKMLDTDPSVWEMPTRKPSDKDQDSGTIDLQPVPPPQDQGSDAGQEPPPPGELGQDSADPLPAENQSTAPQQNETEPRRYD